jgi:hypothetical protein
VIALFRQKTPANIVLMLLFGLLIKLPVFMHPKLVTLPSDGVLYTLLTRSMTGPGGLFLASLLAFFLLYIQAIVVNFIVNEYRMTTRQTFLPAMSFMLITSLVPEWSYLSAPLVASTIILWCVSKVFRLYNLDQANGKIYNTGLLLGLASFFFFPSVLFAICLLIGFMILRPFRLNEFILFLVGTTTPYYFYAVYLYLADHAHWRTAIPKFFIHIPETQPSYWLLGSIILMCIPFLMGGYYIQTNLRKMLIQARKNWSIFLIYLLLSVFIPFVNNTEVYTNWVLVAAPAAAFHACAYLYPPRKWVANLVFVIVITFVLLQQYGPHIMPVSYNR